MNEIKKTKGDNENKNFKKANFSFGKKAGKEGFVTDKEDPYHVKMMKAQKQREFVENEDSKTILVKEIPLLHCNKESLTNLFEQFGKIKEIRIPMNKEIPRGISFIDFESHKSAITALKSIDGYQWNGNHLVVAPAVDLVKKESSNENQNDNQNKNEEKLTKNLTIPKKGNISFDPKTNQAQRRMQTQALQRQQMIKKMQEKNQKEKEEKEKQQKEEKEQKEEPAKIKLNDEVKIQKLNLSSTEESIKEFFENNCGQVKLVRLMKNEEGKSKGYAFVTFEEEQSVEKALSHNKSTIDGNTVKITKANKK